MTPDDILKQLGWGGASKLARIVRRSPSHVHYVLHGVRRDAVVERAVAKRLQKPEAEIFPVTKQVA